MPSDTPLRKFKRCDCEGTLFRYRRTINGWEKVPCFECSPKTCRRYSFLATLSARAGRARE